MWILSAVEISSVTLDWCSTNNEEIGVVFGWWEKDSNTSDEDAKMNQVWNETIVKWINFRYSLIPNLTPSLSLRLFHTSLKGMMLFIWKASFLSRNHFCHPYSLWEFHLTEIRKTFFETFHLVDQQSNKLWRCWWINIEWISLQKFSLNYQCSWY